MQIYYITFTTFYIHFIIQFCQLYVLLASPSSQSGINPSLLPRLRPFVWLSVTVWGWGTLSNVTSTSLVCLLEPVIDCDELGAWTDLNCFVIYKTMRVIFEISKAEFILDGRDQKQLIRGQHEASEEHVIVLVLHSLLCVFIWLWYMVIWLLLRNFYDKKFKLIPFYSSSFTLLNLYQTGLNPSPNE